MASSLRLVVEGEPGSAIDLLTGTLKLAQGSWSTRAPQPEGKYKPQGLGTSFEFQQFGTITETIDLLGTDSSTNLRAATYAIERLLERCRRWHLNPLYQESIWLEWAAEGESARRALIYTGALSILSSPRSNPFVDATALRVRLALTRHPLWESSTAILPDPGTVSTLGGTLWVTPSVASTAPQRIGVLQLTGLTTLTAPLKKVWLGVRNYYDGATYFNPVWECENGTLGTDAALATHTTASPTAEANNYVSVSFATVATDAKRLSIYTLQNSTVPNDQVGRYMVLARCRVGAGTTVALTMRTGMYPDTDDNHVPNAPAYVTGTGWHYEELGRVQIPLSGLRSGWADWGGSTAYTQIQLWAERLDGAGILDLDCLIMVPTDSYAHVEGCNIDYLAHPLLPSSYPLLLRTSESDQVSAIAYLAPAYEAGGPVSVKAETENWYLQPGGGVLVLAAEGETAHVLGESIYVTPLLYPRWLSLSNV